MRFLINPGGGIRMATKMIRDSKGRFVRKAGRSRSNPSKSRKRARRAKRQPRDRYGRFVSKGGGRGRARSNPGRYASNPIGEDLMGSIAGGAMDAVQLTLGKAATRALPPLLNLPEGGNVGLAIHAATAVGIGFVASEFVDRRLGEMMLAGGLQGVVEDLVVGYDVPFLAGALSRAPGIVPATGGGGMGRYSSLGRYSHPTRRVERSTTPGNRLGRYSHPAPSHASNGLN